MFTDYRVTFESSKPRYYILEITLRHFIDVAAMSKTRLLAFVRFTTFVKCR